MFVFSVPALRRCHDAGSADSHEKKPWRLSDISSSRFNACPSAALANSAASFFVSDFQGKESGWASVPCNADRHHRDSHSLFSSSRTDDEVCRYHRSGRQHCGTHVLCPDHYKPQGIPRIRNNDGM